MKIQVSLFFALIFSFACNPEQQIEIPAKSLVSGLATPVKMNPDETEIFLADYFMDLSGLDSISLPPGLTGKLSKDRAKFRIRINDPDFPYYSTMTCWFGEDHYSIVLRKSEKKAVKLGFNPKGKTCSSVQLAGEINGWNPSNANFIFTGNEWTYSLMLNPGSYQYKLVVDGKWISDPANPDSASNNIGGFNSLLVVPKPGKHDIPYLETRSFASGTVGIGTRNIKNGIVVLWDNFMLPETMVRKEGDGFRLTIPEAAKSMKRSFIRVFGYNPAGGANDLLIPLDYGSVLADTGKLIRGDWESAVIYFLMIDRFKNGKTGNDRKVDDPDILSKVNYYGGDLAGVTDYIENGFFKDLGINTIWITPVTRNPEGAYGQWPDPPTRFSGYHGYWPVSCSEVDPRYGTAEDLEQLIRTAHENGISLLLDYVAHHIHIEHPAYKQHPDWFTSLYLPDGSMNTERWDDHRLTTWFDSFLPTLDLGRQEITDVMTDSALFWIEQYGIDGFRHDATKHIPEIFWRTLTRKLREKVIVPKNRRVFQIGETYGSRELISSYIGSGMMDSQFDFGVYDAALAAFAQSGTSFVPLAASLKESLDVYGHHNLMGYMTGNQDKPRFISLAGGSLSFEENSKMAGWKRDIGVGDPAGYKKLQSMLAFIMTIPGVPTIYYGDEFGMPGANDPDNRRMMKFTGLTSEEEETREVARKLIHLRRSELALVYGDTEIVLADDHTLLIRRRYFDRIVYAVFNKSSEPAGVRFTIPEEFAEDSLTCQFGSNYSWSNSVITMNIGGNSFDILTKKDHGR